MGLSRWSTAAVAALAIAAPVFAAPQAAAADLLVLDSCEATVPAGKDIALRPSAVTDPIADRLSLLDPLNVLTPRFRAVWATQPPIALPGGPPGITGATIADAVVGRLRTLTELAPVIDTVVGSVGGRLSLLCGITVLAERPAEPAQPDPAPAPAEDLPRPPAPSAAPAMPPPEPTIVLPGYSPSGGDPVDPAAGGGTLGVGSAEPAAGPGGLSMAVTSMAVAADPAPGEPRHISWPAILATLMIMLVGTHLGRVWVLNQPEAWRTAGQVGSSGRSARPLDPTANPDRISGRLPP